MEDLCCDRHYSKCLEYASSLNPLSKNYYDFRITEETEAQRANCATERHSAREICRQYFNLGSLCSECTLKHYSFALRLVRLGCPENIQDTQFTFNIR